MLAVPYADDEALTPIELILIDSDELAEIVNEPIFTPFVFGETLTAVNPAVRANVPTPDEIVRVLPVAADDATETSSLDDCPCALFDAPPILAARVPVV
jgi:predicted RNA-binding protein associated with RNAse of E/G family